ncbi:MAG: T9SS type A sorting domain-containing protein [Candidatus Kapabacteria bacterium]|nr:T9SS type A sorting domain-containing protein [Candidatus Kapabacteria bacterium]
MERKRALRLMVCAAIIVLSKVGTMYAQAVDYLLILDPRQGFNRATGRIEEATVAVRPRGLYMEYGLFLTISPRGTAMASSGNQNLEIVMNFGLPPNAIVTDSWLWVGDSIMQAQIKDYWTASSIYETIVGMRRDPSIFTKTNDRYELRVYPISATGVRKIKIAYLVPLDWSSDRVSAPLPLNLLKTSAFMPPLKIMFWGNNWWSAPQVDEFSDIVFAPVRDTANGNFLSATLQVPSVAQKLTFSTKSPLQNGVYVSAYHNGKEGFYQMAFRPSEVLQTNEAPKKVCIVIDYDATKSSTTLAQTLKSLQESLLANASPKDSFNVVFSRLSVELASASWLATTRDNLDKIFARINTMMLYGALPNLVLNGVTYAAANNGVMLLVANSDGFTSSADANQLVKDLQSSVKKIPPVTILDFCDKGRSISVGGRSYYGNGYLYTNLAQISGGAAFSTRELGTISAAALQSAQSLSGNKAVQLDMYSTMHNGFCFSRYSVIPTSEALSSQVGRLAPASITDGKKMVLQTGKFLGSLPFTLSLAGTMSSLPVAKTIVATTAQIELIGGVNEQIWSANYMSSLLPTGSVPSNAAIAEIVAKSLEYRVLSNYTAFLALEPNDTLRACQNCTLTSDNQRGGSSSGIQLGVALNYPDLGVRCTISPNPFSTETSIEITLKENLQPEKCSLSICNAMGQVLTTISLDGYVGQSVLRFRWDGEIQSGGFASPGLYFLMLKTPSGLAVWKLLKTS